MSEGDQERSSGVPEVPALEEGGNSAVAGPAEEAEVVVAPPPGIQQAQRLAEQGRYAEAVALFTSALESDPDDVPALLGLGLALLAMGQYDAAEKELRKALRVAPAQTEVRLHLGIVLFKRGVYAAAATELRRVLEVDPDSASASMVLGEALNQMGESDAAIEAFENAARVQPSSKAFYGLGIAFDRKGQPERAAEMYRRSRELSGR